MAKIDDVIEYVNKKITFYEWRDETHVTMRLDKVLSMLREIYELATGSQRDQRFDLTLNATHTTVVFDVEGEPLNAGSNVLKYGDKLRITATADNGYTLETLTVNGEAFANGSTITVLDNLVVNAVSTINTYDLSVTADEGVTLTIYKDGEEVSQGSGVLEYGDVITFEVDPAESVVTINNQAYTAGDEFVVTSNVEITATAPQV